MNSFEWLGRRCVAGMTLGLMLALCAALALPGCGERSDSSGDETSIQDQTAYTAEPMRDRVEAGFAPSRETPELAARSLRHLAITSWDPKFIRDFMDPSQSELVEGFLGYALIYYAALAELRDAAAARFGEEGGVAIDHAPLFIVVELGNGLREMFVGERFEVVRREGSTAYVNPMLEDGQPIGAPLVFRDHQGEWLLLLADGDDPWPSQRLSMYTSMMRGPMEHGAISQARALGELARRVHRGDIRSIEAMLIELDRVSFPEG